MNDPRDGSLSWRNRNIIDKPVIALVCVLAQHITIISSSTARMTTAVEEMFVHVAPLLPFYARVFACNLWLFTPLLEVRTQRTQRTPLTYKLCGGAYSSR